MVMFSAENKNYMDVAGINGMLKDNFFRFLHKELPDFVAAMTPALTEPEHTYIAGLSMGGMGTLLHGLSHPEQYKAMGVFSMGGELPDEMPPQPDSLQPYKLAQKVVDDGKKFPKMFIGCGEEDWLYPRAQKLRDTMVSLGADVTWVSKPGYAHEWRLWDQLVEEFLDWIPRTDAYAGTKRKI